MLRNELVSARERLAIAFPRRALRGATDGGWGAHSPAEPRAGEGGPTASAGPGVSPASRGLSRASYNSSLLGEAPLSGCGAPAPAGGSGSITGGGSLPLPCVSAPISRAYAVRTFVLKTPPDGARDEVNSAGPPPAGALPVAGPIRTFFGQLFVGQGHRYSK